MYTKNSPLIYKLCESVEVFTKNLSLENVHEKFRLPANFRENLGLSKIRKIVGVFSKNKNQIKNVKKIPSGTMFKKKFPENFRFAKIFVKIFIVAKIF